MVGHYANPGITRVSTVVLTAQDSSNINKLDSVVIFAFKERDLKVVAYFVCVCSLA
jgi:hypothetical protein